MNKTCFHELSVDHTEGVSENSASVPAAILSAHMGVHLLATGYIFIIPKECGWRNKFVLLNKVMFES